ncbi:glycine cleavage system P-family protein, partial [Vibrio cholerae CP1035(8)]
TASVCTKSTSSGLCGIG